MSTPTIPTPMCDRLAEIGDKFAGACEFLGWLRDQGYVIATYETTPNGYERLTRVAGDDLAFRAFDLDLAELDRERRALIDEQRRRIYGEPDPAQDFGA